VTVGGAGQLVLSGKRIKRRSRSAQQAGKVTLPIVIKGKALSALRKSGKAKVQLSLAFTPPGGSTATQTESATLKLKRSS
jgi:hypothetical protein